MAAKVTITYDGNTIHETTASETADLLTAGTVAAGNISFNVEDVQQISITYKGEVIASFVGSKVFELLTNGKYLQEDIAVDIQISSAPTTETWIFKEDLSEYHPLSNQNFSVNFTSDSAEFIGISVTGTRVVSQIRYQRATTGSITAATIRSGTTSWSEAYRTIVLDEPATGDFLAWLQTYAVKQ